MKQKFLITISILAILALSACGGGEATPEVSAEDIAATADDGSLLIGVDDASPLPSGGATAEFWTDPAGSVMAVDEVRIGPLGRDDRYNLASDTTLGMPARGVLTNDTGLFGTNPSATVMSGPGHGTLTLTNNRGFAYTPAAGYSGYDNFIYQLGDGVTNVGTAVVTLTVIGPNTPPVLPVQINRSIAELTLLTVTNSATDTDVPPNTLSYQLINAPEGAVISPGGVMTWTPTEAQGPGTNVIMTVVTDDGSPVLSATNTFTVVVNWISAKKHGLEINPFAAQPGRQ